MNHPSLAEFEAAAGREGFDEVAERIWPANTVVETHQHPFAVKAIVVAVVVTDSGRPLPRIGGLQAGEIKGEDGLR